MSDNETDPTLIEAQRRGEAIAREVLGPALFKAPVTAILLPNAAVMTRGEWIGTKKIFLADAKTQTDLQHFGQLMAKRASEWKKEGVVTYE